MKKPSNISVEIYIVENYGENVSDDKLIKVAKEMNLKPNVLIKNYKQLCLIRSIFKD
jgi:hypothetical protein